MKVKRTTPRQKAIRYVRMRLNYLAMHKLFPVDDIVRNVYRQLKEAYCHFELEGTADGEDICQYLDDLSDVGYTRLVNEILKPERSLWLKVGQSSWECKVWCADDAGTEDLMYEWIDIVFPQDTSKGMEYGWT